MKTKTTYSILFISLLIPVISVHAVEVQASTTVNVKGPRMEMKQELKAERAETRADIKELRTEAKAEIKEKMVEMKATLKEAKAKKLDERAKVRVEARLNRIYTHLAKRITHLVKVDAEITKRLSTRVASSSVTTLHMAAKTALVQAKLDVEATKASSTVALNATTSNAIFRSLVETAEASIKTTAEAYRKIVPALAKLPKIQVTATTTASTTITN
ncbi:MAG: hypothetical protein V4686_02590 [Patescibacteria group bacterium]